MTTIDVCFVTWPITDERIVAFAKCVSEWTARLRCDDGDLIGWYCSTETGGCTPLQLNAVRDICHYAQVILNERRETPDQGSNLNVAMRMPSGDFLIMVMDDFHLAAELNVSPHYRFLTERPDVSTVRYGWISSTFTGDIEGTDLQWVNMKGGYPYATAPSLWRANWEEEFGPWEENKGYCKPENHRNHQMIVSGRPIACTKFNYGKWDGTKSTREHRMDGLPLRT
jgi:hypothetical protein